MECTTKPFDTYDSISPPYVLCFPVGLSVNCYSSIS